MEAMKTRKDEQPRTDTNKDVKTSKKPKRRSPQRPAGDSTRGRMTAAVTHLAFYPPNKTPLRETPQWRKPKRKRQTAVPDACRALDVNKGIANTGAKIKGADHEPDTMLHTKTKRFQALSITESGFNCWSQNTANQTHTAIKSDDNTKSQCAQTDNI